MSPLPQLHVWVSGPSHNYTHAQLCPSVKMTLFLSDVGTRCDLVNTWKGLGLGDLAENVQNPATSFETKTL